MSLTDSTIVGFGAGALDFYPPYGQIGPDHQPGAKVGWTEREEQMLPALQDGGVEHHIGGNVMNTLAYLATIHGGKVQFAGVLGVDDAASSAIRAHMPEMGILDYSVTVPGYKPSISIVEHMAPGSDRMVRGRPRDAQSRHISQEVIRDRTSAADVVVAASLKDLDMTRRIFDAASEDTILSYNPGSSEFESSPKELVNVMRDRQPTLLALNDEELRQLFGDADTDIRKLAAHATQLSQYVLCTLGKDGALLAHDGESIHGAAELLPSTAVVDTLGAGDRAHAVAIEGLLLGSSPEDTLAEVARQTASVIQNSGAHGDLYASIRGNLPGLRTVVAA